MKTNKINNAIETVNAKSFFWFIKQVALIRDIHLLRIAYGKQQF